MAANIYRASLPDSIFYNGNNYKVNIAYSAKHTEGVLFPVCKHIKVHVLSARLKGKRDLHGNLYTPTVWIFTIK